MGDMPNQHGSSANGSLPDLSTVWLRVFLAVAGTGSFTVTARALGWTQSAVSRQISSLELALGGAPLFDRLPRGCGSRRRGGCSYRTPRRWPSPCTGRSVS